ncbi:RNA degradosome polyphosphate kinase [Georgenia ruanii]|uniref:Polyphosphate kinase n=2 Tax=Georgenia ruanii TaxID=348442 RepID=A0A7J9UUV6_9MICO|nr:RNA degradosome polyphosphate kinase [Georgenia ruanii]MPV88415.1 RNA degradosome polyphosphate kinase [Georgenia ruanii]
MTSSEHTDAISRAADPVGPRAEESGTRAADGVAPAGGGTVDDVRPDGGTDARSPDPAQLVDDAEDELADQLETDADDELAAQARAMARMLGGVSTSASSLSRQVREARAEALEDHLPPSEAELPEGRFADRELSWLAFNERVLEQAEDQDLPLLERAWFLAIFASNLDEFYMVRVAGLKRRMATGMAVTAASGLSPRQVLDAISAKAKELAVRHAHVFADDVQPKLAEVGIELLHWDDLGQSEQDRLHKFFRKQIFPVLTPLAVDPAHPFPYISGLSLNLAVLVRNPASGKEHFARVKVPPLLPRFIAVDSEGRPYRPEDVPADAGGRTAFVPLEEVIGHHLDALFPGMEIIEHHTFRVTRNEDLEVEEDDAENLLKALEKELVRRRFGPAVRLEVAEGISPHVLDLLMRELQVGEKDVFHLPAPLDLTGLDLVHDLDRPSLKYPKFVPVTAQGLAEVESANPTDFFNAIRQQDILLHHPYDSFSTSVQQFIAQAAADPHVLAIKQTLYRTSGDSPIVDALIDAAEAGKQVLAIVEIKARFDEQANITWARKLEQAGVHVVYGIVGLKTHAKLCLVVRQEPDGLRRYCHVGTGNYHPKTARGYEDLGLLTCDRDVGQDLTRLFNQLSGYAPRTRFHRLLVAPRSIRPGLIERIEREIENKRAGRPAWVKFKANSIVDEAIIDALYRASQAGVPVDVVVRGICALRAGVPGLSENIRVRSILGRFLEHARIYAFGNDGDPEVWIGSADLMHRNLDRRVEALIRIVDPGQIDFLVELLDVSVADTTSTWHLGTDGWHRVNRGPDGQRLDDLQEMLMARARSRVAARR